MAELSNYRRDSKELSNFGHYAIGGTIPILPSQAADSVLFSFFWGTVENADFVCAIDRLYMAFQQTSNSMEALTDIRYQVFIVRNISVPDSGGLVGTIRDLRAAQSDTLVTHVLESTVIAGLTEGTRDLDTGPLMQLQTQVVKTIPTSPVPVFERELAWNTAGVHPLILEQNEGVIVCGPTTEFSTGTGNLLFEMEWTELGEY